MTMFAKFRAIVQIVLRMTLPLVCLLVMSEAPAATGPQAAPIGLFDAIDNDKIEVKLVVRSGDKAKMIAKNKTDRPLTIEIPESFAALPVLAQAQGGAATGGGLFNVPPEKFAKYDMGFLCLEHGKPDPRSTTKYEIKPISAITNDGRVIEVLNLHGAGHLSHAVAQAAVWHLANQIGWQQLASKRRRQLVGADDPYFSHATLLYAAKVVSYVTNAVQQQEAAVGSNYSLAR